MSKVVSITSQGQVTIPKNIRDEFGISGSSKATVKVSGDEIIIKPQRSVSSFSGSLKTDISLNDQELKNAREKFSVKWPQDE